MDTKKEENDPNNKELNGFWIKKAENGSLPDFMLRTGICQVMHTNLNKDLQKGGMSYHTTTSFINNIMRPEQQINIHPDKANEQHYELPTQVFEYMLGDNLKYSCSFWEELEWHPLQDEQSRSFFSDVLSGTSPMVKKFEKGKSVRQLLTKAEENMLNKFEILEVGGFFFWVCYG